MADFATSADPAVQAQLDRLWALSPGADILGLGRVAELLARLGDPHLRLPPVFHVAGTNGKGSTCAFLRAALEADGKRVHVYTSPHLVRFNERIRVAGSLIEDAALAPLLARVIDHAEGIGASFFEVTTAAAFLAFAETPADACVIEVGLGGRLDATNVIADPAVCGIAQLGIDHQAFLGDTAEQIAREKAGIAKPGRPLVTQSYPFSITAAVADAAGDVPIFAENSAWHQEARGARFHYRDREGAIETPLPALTGTHQHANLGLAIAMLRHQDRVAVAPSSFQAAALAARWPARMQRLSDGPLYRYLDDGAEIWLDGGHNAAAAHAIAHAVREQAQGRPIHLVLGMLANKDMAGLINAFAFAASLTAVPVPGHEHHDPAHIALTAERLGIGHAGVARDVPHALRHIMAAEWTGPSLVLILGSLYLAGEVLALNDEPPE
jgi:dihydrofolate synthase/folylpolyglutamate synthase